MYSVWDGSLGHSNVMLVEPTMWPQHMSADLKSSYGFVLVKQCCSYNAADPGSILWSHGYLTCTRSVHFFTQLYASHQWCEKEVKDSCLDMLFVCMSCWVEERVMAPSIAIEQTLLWLTKICFWTDPLSLRHSLKHTAYDQDTLLKFR